MTADQPLALWPDEVDVELPLDEVAEVAREGTPAQIIDALADEVTVLRRALVDTLAHVEAGTPAPGNRVRAWRELAGTAHVDGLEPLERRDEGIARASAKWTDDEVAAVDKAIATVAARHRKAYLDWLLEQRPEGEEPWPYPNTTTPADLTTADVWQELDGSVPVTKGIAGRMLAAKAAGLIVNTGRTVIAPRESTGPNHGQRLTVWRAA